MQKIPVLATQTLNGLSNIKRLLVSIDYPVNILSIVINNEDYRMFDEIRDYCNNNLNKTLIEKVDISFHPTNLGCAGSWNYHFKAYPDADFYIKADDDICFQPNDLLTMVRKIREDKFDMVFYSMGTKYAFFGITKNTLKKVGLFDENIHPAYYEDDDYDVRRKHHQIKSIILDLKTSHNSSSTCRNISEEEKQKIDKCVFSNRDYFHNKINSERVYSKFSDFDFTIRENKIFRFKGYS